MFEELIFDKRERFKKKLTEKFFDCCSTAEFGQQLFFKKKREKKRTLHGNHWETNEYNILRMHVSARVTA